MNVSLTTAYTDDMFVQGDGESIQSQIDEHQDIMRGAQLRISGPVVLVPEGTDYPGSYRVWNSLVDMDGDPTVWVWVNPEGEPMYTTDPIAFKS